MQVSPYQCFTSCRWNATSYFKNNVSSRAVPVTATGLESERGFLYFSVHVSEKPNLSPDLKSESRKVEEESDLT